MTLHLGNPTRCVKALQKPSLTERPISFLLTRTALRRTAQAGYHKKTALAFSKLYALSGAKSPITLKLDCANGVGAVQFARTVAAIGPLLKVQFFNDGTSGKLNHKCGADHVKVGCLRVMGEWACITL